MDQVESAELKKETSIIIDGMNLFLRHFAANPTVSVQGTPAGGVVGMIRGIGILCDKFFPTNVTVVWEGGGSSRRRQLYSEYKAHRKPVRLNRFHAGDIPDTVGNRDDQVRAIIGCLRSTGIQQLYVEDCEADDVIAYLCTKQQNNKIIIISSDKDYYQLLNDDITIYNPGTKSIITRNDVIEKYGISPVNFALAKAICGDISDNIKGVKGIQFKTALLRFPLLADDQQHEIIDIIEYANSQIKIGTKLKAYNSIIIAENKIHLNLKLVALNGEMLDSNQRKRIDYQCDSFEPNRNKINFIRTLIELGLNTTFDVDRFFRSTSVITKR